MTQRIAVAMSGGVDSSAAACLLLDQGYELSGVTMRLFSPGDSAGPSALCRAMEDIEDARAVARQLGIPHHTLDLSGPFRKQVMDTFVAAYESGQTPNPCVDCNRNIKFGALLQCALDLGLEKVATGHYARLEYDTGSGRWLLKKALHPEKDQSYVLATLAQEQLCRAVFPLGSLSKEEIRAVAQTRSLVNARKRDSQDICFIPDGDYGTFLRRHTGKEYPSGSFLSPDGKTLGQHTGIVDYTLGQRRGLGVSSNAGRLYVRQICPANNTVVLSDNASLFSRSLDAGKLNLIPCTQLSGTVRLRAKVRYRMSEQPCQVVQTGPSSIHLTFDEPQRAITPGQTVVLYDGDVVVGGATIL